MPSQAGGYWVDGKRVPSVTTVISSRKSGTDGLMGWANRAGLDGKTLDQARDVPANAGSLAHDMIEQFIQGKEPEISTAFDDDTLRKARQGFESFLEWTTTSKIVLVGTERGLVSTLYKYGGTLDCEGTQYGEPVILDWKVTNRLYPDNLIQVAAYRQLKEENDGVRIERVHLCRFGKEYASFGHSQFSREQVDIAFEQFKTLLRARELDYILGKMV